MNPFSAFLAEAKVNPKIWNRLTFKAGWIMGGYSLLTYGFYYFGGIENLGGKNANLPLLFSMLLITAFVLAMFLLGEEVMRERNKNSKDDQKN